MKRMVIWAIRTTDDEWHSSIKCYCRTKLIAKRELKKYCDWYCQTPPKPDEKHIEKIEVIVE